jgi:hypothetical protein
MRDFLKKKTNRDEIQRIVTSPVHIQRTTKNLKRADTSFNGISISAKLGKILTFETLLGLGLEYYYFKNDPTIVGAGSIALTIETIRRLWPFITAALNFGYPCLETLCRFLCECVMRRASEPLGPERVRAILFDGDPVSAPASAVTPPTTNTNNPLPVASAVVTAMPRATIFSYAHII